MSRVRMAWCAGVLAAVAVVVLACSRPRVITPHAKPMMLAGLPECAHKWDLSRTSVLTSFAGEIKDVPEFHDCQRLVVPGEARRSFRYDSIAAVFANPRGANYSDDSLLTPRALALIFFPYGGSYDTLHLTTQLSCLWIQRVGGSLSAWVRPVLKSEDCLDATVGGSDRSRSLTVRSHDPGPPKHNLPTPIYNVARWDWDPVTSTQFIGVRCGSAWCEVGVAGFGDSKDHLAGDTEDLAAFRSLRVKGNYDEQHLAEWGAGPLRVGENLGTIFPTPQLAAFGAQPPTKGRWTRVAQINMSPRAGPYEQMLNLVGNDRPLVGGPLATLSLCFGDATSCSPRPGRVVLNPLSCEEADGGRWYARIDREGRTPQFYCVVHRPHPNVKDIPPVVRWRWREDDETIWVRCPAGCCEVNVSDDPDM